jgi:protein-disulfide isomerase
MQDMRIAWVSNTLTERMLEKEAARAGKPVHTLATEAMQGPVEVSDSALAAMITILAGSGAVITPAETLQVRAALARQNQEHRFERYVDSLRRVYGMEIHLQPMPVVNPQLDFTGSAGFGPAGAPASFVVFTDFECPHCAGLAGTMEELSRRNPSKIAVTIKHYPLAVHPRAARAAEASLCAGAQGKFKQYHDLLFAGQKDLSDTALIRLAGEAGADTAVFRACLASGFHEQFIRRDSEEAERIGVTGTPTVFLNGRPLLGELTLDRLQTEVEMATR